MELTDKEKLILWLEEGERSIELACEMIEKGQEGVLGVLHKELARIESKKKKLLIEQAEEAEKERERALESTMPY